ncbi:MAG: hypothetical protein ABI678_02400, partial [Kofleriaceae bacterium]
MGGEYADRGRSYAQGSATTSADRKPIEPTPKDIAHAAQLGLEFRIKDLRVALATLETARAQNDLPRWQVAHQQVEHAIARADQARTSAIARAEEAQVRDDPKLRARERELVEETERAQDLRAPRGYQIVDHERALVAAVCAMAGADPETLARSEATARAWIDALSGSDLKTLEARIASRRPYDELATAIAKLPAETRHRVVSFAHDTERRKARERVARPAPIEPPPVETVEQRIDGAFERAYDEQDPDVRDGHLTRVFASLATAERETLVRRLETYRPGLGDGLGARFARFDRSTRQQILTLLQRPRVATPTAEAEDRRAEHTNRASQLHEPGYAARYLELHRPAILTTLRAQLSSRVLGTGNAHLHWHTDAAAFVAAVANELTGPEPDEWPGLLHPGDPWQEIDRRRSVVTGARGEMGWIPTIGLALAGELELA